jgi:hypothetical protein
MKKIQLTQGKIALVDDDLFDYLNSFNWSVNNSGGRSQYAMRKFRDTDGRWKALKMHHVVLGKPKGRMEADHIDGNSLNNQRKNLRWATKSQNQHNRFKQKNNTSGYKGVTQYRRTGRWVSRVQVENKRIVLGTFETAKEAGKAYAEYVKKNLGGFARLT